MSRWTRALAILLLGCGSGTCKSSKASRPSEPSRPSETSERSEPGGGDATAPSPPAARETPGDEDAPPKPDSELPPPPEGFRSIGELRKKGEALFGIEVKVEGYVIWIYDCESELREAGHSKREAKKLVKDEPERCDRPSFYLGPSPSASKTQSLWVVEVPRPPRPDEKKVLPKEELDSWPEVPQMKVGDRVVVTGTWDQSSPRGFRSIEGLLIYESLWPAEGAASP